MSVLHTIDKIAFKHTMTMTKQQETYIAYYRVSTAEQGNSGLGLEAQKRDVRN